MLLSYKLKFRWSCKITAYHIAGNLSNTFMIDVPLLARNCELYFCIVHTPSFVLLFFHCVVGNVMFWHASTEPNTLWEWISVCCQGVSQYRHHVTIQFVMLYKFVLSYFGIRLDMYMFCQKFEYIFWSNIIIFKWNVLVHTMNPKCRMVNLVVFILWEWSSHLKS